MNYFNKLPRRRAAGYLNDSLAFALRNKSILPKGRGIRPIVIKTTAIFLSWVFSSVSLAANKGAMVPVISLLLDENPNRAPDAVLSGVTDGVEGTTFNVSAAGSSDPDGDALTYDFDATGDCSVQSESGSSATIQRASVGVAGGTCNVSVAVDDGSLTDTDSDSAVVQDNVTP